MTRKQVHLTAMAGEDSDNDGAIRVVAAAMALAATGLPRQRIADILGVSRSTVYRLLQVRDRLAAVVAGIDEASAAFDVDAVIAAHTSSKRRRPKPGSSQG